MVGVVAEVAVLQQVEASDGAEAVVAVAERVLLIPRSLLLSLGQPKTIQ